MVLFYDFPSNCTGLSNKCILTTEIYIFYDANMYMWHTVYFECQRPNVIQLHDITGKT